MDVSFPIPAELEAFLETQLQSGDYDSVADYFLALLQQDCQRKKAQAKLQRLLQEGLDSETEPVTAAYWQNLQISELVTQFYDWKDNLVINDNILGGEAVFPHSRLSVCRIGGMLAKGESYEVILEDYPYLNHKDLKFAEIYVKAYPMVERPKQG